MRRNEGATSSSVDWAYLGSLALIVISLLLTIYVVGPPNPPSIQREARIPFELDRPDRTYPLPPDLKEVSAVVVARSEPVAWAVNDEQATLFRIDLHDGSVEAGQTFAKPGDYEGIELIDGEWVVARSDGKLWRVGPEGVHKVKSPLSKRCDVEGLAWDELQSRLLVACKGKAGLGVELEHARAVYAVQLPTYEWRETPAFVVERDALQRFLEDHGNTGRKPRAAKSFAPSGIGIDPITQNIYMLSSAGRMLVVLDAEAENLIEVVTLSRGVHAQPEGLAFSAEGSLYISNEGRGGTAKLYRFDRGRDLTPSTDEGE